MPFRTEHDSLGDVQVPADAYWGAQTQRAIGNFPISGRRMPPAFIHALGLVKRACALANESFELLPTLPAEWISAAAREVQDGQWDDQFPVDVFQTGSGTSTNMNANEVIANRANELMGGELGLNTPIHPNDHVNLSQSSNDVIPTTTHVAVAVATQERLVPALRILHAALAAKAVAFDSIVKTGRTHLMDATPIRLGQEFAGYAAQVEMSIERALRARNALLELALGGTAVGTGINRPVDFPARAIAHIADNSAIPFREARNHVAAQASPDAVVEASGQLRAVASALTKIAEDLRWLASGPNAGIGEIRLPSLQPGSSIMPGKVNPVLCEMLIMVGAQVVGNDAAIGHAARSGAFELHTAWPLLADRLLDSVHLLAQGARTFAERCVAGIEADEAACRAGLDHNPMLVTALAPTIGYERAATIAKEAARTGQSVREVASATVDAATLDRLLDVRAMTEPGGRAPGGG